MGPQTSSQLPPPFFFKHILLNTHSFNPLLGNWGATVPGTTHGAKEHQWTKQPSGGDLKEFTCWQEDAENKQ